MKKMTMSGWINHFYILRDEVNVLFRASNEKIRSIQYELLTARTEVEQANEKVF
jgi:hypothetical protein